jgi:hypothetical protein
MSHHTAYIGYNGTDYWDVITGPDRASVEKTANRSADRAERSEGKRPAIEIISLYTDAN